MQSEVDKVLKQFFVVSIRKKNVVSNHSCKSFSNDWFETVCRLEMVTACRLFSTIFLTFGHLDIVIPPSRQL